MKTILAGENVSKVFGESEERVTALDNVSVSIEQGEFVAIMGPSGSGKSTLMFTLSGMDSIDGGKVIFDDKELSSLKENELADVRRTRMGFIFQQPTLLKNLNILDNIILPSLRSGKADKSLMKKAKDLMTETGIDGIENRNTAQVSGGQLQRAGICRALLSEPSIIFGDEPTGALNSKTSLEIMDILVRINEGGTAVMVVTHDTKVAARAERILYMKDGKIIDELRLSKFDKADVVHRTALVNERMQQYDI